MFLYQREAVSGSKKRKEEGTEDGKVGVSGFQQFEDHTNIYSLSVFLKGVY